MDHGRLYQHPLKSNENYMVFVIGGGFVSGDAASGRGERSLHGGPVPPLAGQGV